MKVEKRLKNDTQVLKQTKKEIKKSYLFAVFQSNFSLRISSLEYANRFDGAPIISKI
jgi:hypothetical protein